MLRNPYIQRLSYPGFCIQRHCHSTQVRFAPSPTGLIHLGSLRTALFNYLIAKKNNGNFLLRIEDTDQKRTVDGAQEKLIRDLEWVGLKFDYGPGKEGPYGSFIQSKRSEIYKRYAFELIEKGHAYRCFCTPERLEQVRTISKVGKLATNYDRHCLRLSPEEEVSLMDKCIPYVVRFKVPEKNESFTFQDVVHGKKSVSYRTIDDVVLLKSDGLPTYHLANVVDDHLMNITHVIRGQEWLPSTPKHILLYEAFGWTPPTFAHLPLLIHEDGSKLSKRHNDVHLDDLKGYLPEALLNFIAFLGWNPGNKKKFYTLDELVRDFDLSQVQKSGAKVSYHQLDHLNKLHVAHQLQDPEKRPLMLTRIKQICKEKGMGVVINDDEFAALVEAVQSRAQTLQHFPSLLSPFFQEPVYEKEIIQRVLIDVDDILSTFCSELKALKEWNPTNIKNLLETVPKNREKDYKTMTFSIRYILTGSQVGISLNRLIHLLGKNQTLSRIEASNKAM